MLSVPQSTQAMVSGQVPARASGARSSDPTTNLGGRNGGAGWNRLGVEGRGCSSALGSTPPGLRIGIHTARTRESVFRHREGPQQGLHPNVGRRSARGIKANRRKRKVSRKQLVELKRIHAAKARGTRRSSARGWGAHSRSAPAGRRTTKVDLEIDPAIAPRDRAHHRATARAGLSDRW